MLKSSGFCFIPLKKLLMTMMGKIFVSTHPKFWPIPKFLKTTDTDTEADNFPSLLLEIFHECLLTRPNKNPIFVKSMIPTKLCKSFDCLQILCCLVECTNTQILTGSD